jgi:hypothetical protein
MTSRHKEVSINYRLYLLAIDTIEAAYQLENSKEVIRNFIINIEHIRSEEDASNYARY